MALELAVDNQGGNSVALAKVCAIHKGMAVACCCAAMSIDTDETVSPRNR